VGDAERPKVFEPSHGVGEKHDAEAREHPTERVDRLKGNDIAQFEADAGALVLDPRSIHHRAAEIDAEDGAGATCDKFAGGRAGAASNVKDPSTGHGPNRVHRRCAERFRETIVDVGMADPRLPNEVVPNRVLSRHRRSLPPPEALESSPTERSPTHD
jgi:hypothetical protein